MKSNIPQYDPCAANGMTLEELADQYRSPGIQWATYPNPMRTDGLFVAEKRSIESYELGSLYGVRYPATAQTLHAIAFQLPHADAEALVKLLNS